MAITRCTCPSCHATLKLPAPLPAGRRIKCPRCATPFPIPKEEAPDTLSKPTRSKSRPGPAPAVAERGFAREGSARYAETTAGRPGRARRPAEEELSDEQEPEQEEEPQERVPRRRTAGKGKPRQVSRALRISALVLGLIGGSFSGTLGAMWMAQAHSPEVKALHELTSSVANEYGSQELKAGLARLDRLVTASYFLLLAAPLGIAGGVLAVSGRRKLGGALMLAAVPAPLALSVVTLMPLYFLVVGGLLALLMPSWPPRGGPSPATMGWLTAGGWVLVLVGWVALILALPKPVPELNTEHRPAAVPPVQPGGVADRPVPGSQSSGIPGFRAPGPVASGKRVEVALGIDGYPDVAKRGVKVGQTIKVQGNLYVGEDGRVSLSLGRLYEGTEPAVSAVELTRAAADRAAAQKKYTRPDGTTLVEGVLAELRPDSFSLALAGAGD